jgi:hypothetical protein
MVFILCGINNLLADCFSDTNSYNVIIEKGYCNSQYAVIGHVVRDIPNSKKYAFLPITPIEKNHHEYMLCIDSIIKGQIKDTASVFCGNTTTICYKFEHDKWPWYRLENKGKFILFMRKDSLATIKNGKPIFLFNYAFPDKLIPNVLINCENAVKNNCVNNIRPNYDTAIVNSVHKNLLNSDKKKK